MGKELRILCYDTVFFHQYEISLTCALQVFVGPNRISVLRSSQCPTETSAVFSAADPSTLLCCNAPGLAVRSHLK